MKHADCQPRAPTPSQEGWACFTREDIFSRMDKWAIMLFAVLDYTAFSKYVLCGYKHFCWQVPLGYI